MGEDSVVTCLDAQRIPPQPDLRVLRGCEVVVYEFVQRCMWEEREGKGGERGRRDRQEREEALPPYSFLFMILINGLNGLIGKWLCFTQN